MPIWISLPEQIIIQMSTNDMNHKLSLTDYISAVTQ